jgi:hypothetical protein
MRAILASTLGLFLFGSNFCLVSAFVPARPGGAAMSCHAEAPATTGGSCCHPVQTDEPPPPPTAGSPCCLLLTAVSGPSIDKLTPADPLSAFATVVAMPIVLDFSSARRVADDGPPPGARHDGAPSTCRAPPCA